MKTRVAVYCRCSTSSQTLDIQINDLTRYANAREFTIVEIFKDTGVSGVKNTRPALDEMMKLVRKKKVDIVLIWKLDRLGRNVSGLLNMIEEFEALNIALISYKETLDFSSPIGRVMATVLSALTAFERDTLRERVIAGLENAKKNGVILGRPKKSLDIELVKSMRADGMSYREISFKLKVSSGLIHKRLNESILPGTG